MYRKTVVLVGKLLSELTKVRLRAGIPQCLHRDGLQASTIFYWNASKLFEKSIVDQDCLFVWTAIQPSLA